MPVSHHVVAEQSVDSCGSTSHVIAIDEGQENQMRVGVQEPSAEAKSVTIPAWMRRSGLIIGRATLGLLAAIHLVLPYTPANESTDIQIYVAAAVIGGVFAWLTW